VSTPGSGRAVPWPGSETIELVLRVQGVGPGQPRKVVIPYAMLLGDDEGDYYRGAYGKPAAAAGSTFRGISRAYFGSTSAATHSSMWSWSSRGWSRMNWLTPAST